MKDDKPQLVLGEITYTKPDPENQIITFPKAGTYHLKYNGKSKFKQDGSYLPKEPDHIVDDWRLRKGFKKDHSKGGCWCKLGRYYKTNGNRRHRRWMRKLIHSEKYDHLYWHQDMFVSSWDAC